jgi:hypothetical protein
MPVAEPEKAAPGHEVPPFPERQQMMTPETVSG